MKLTEHQLSVLKGQYRLSPRELAVVELIAQGVDSNAEIAERLGIGLGTAKRYVHEILTKMLRTSKLDLAVLIADLIIKGKL